MRDVEGPDLAVGRRRGPVPARPTARRALPRTARAAGWSSRPRCRAWWHRVSIAGRDHVQRISTARQTADLCRQIDIPLDNDTTYQARASRWDPSAVHIVRRGEPPLHHTSPRTSCAASRRRSRYAACAVRACSRRTARSARHTEPMLPAPAHTPPTPTSPPAPAPSPLRMRRRSPLTAPSASPRPPAAPHPGPGAWPRPRGSGRGCGLRVTPRRCRSPAGGRAVMRRAW